MEKRPIAAAAIFILLLAGGLLVPHYREGHGVHDMDARVEIGGMDTFQLALTPGQRSNRPIVLEPVADRSVFVDEWLNLTFAAVDPDDDEPYFEVYSVPEIDLSLDNSSGEFSYLAVPEDVGVVMITVTVTDNNGSIDQDEFRMEVQFRNYPPEVEPIPTITTVPGARKIHQLRFSDPNGDKVTVKIESTETPFSITINNYYQLSFMANRGQDGDYGVVLNFSDNNGTFTLLGFRIIILPENRPPEILPIMDQTLEFGQELVLQVMVIEDDPDVLTFSIRYSGEGEATINESGWLRIVPFRADIGNRTVIVEVDDNNGSVVSESFYLYTYIVNHPPVVPGQMVIRVEAGDILTAYFDVDDPDGEMVYVFPNESQPEWAFIHEPSLMMVLTPERNDIGTHRFTIRFMDDEFEGDNMEVVIIVQGTSFPEWSYPETYEMMERETVTFDLDIGYSKNGTPWHMVSGLKDFMSLKDTKLRISPLDGNSGEHVLWISYGITNGTDAEPRELRIVVHRNLSGFWHVAGLEPDKESYVVGDTIVATCDWGGYEAPITLRWEWVVEDSVYSYGTGTYSTVTVNFTGNWHLYLYLEGVETPLFAKDFQVKKAEDDGKVITWGMLLVSAGVLLVAAAVLVFGYITTRKLMKKYREAMEPPVQEEIVLPQGFRSPPLLNAEMPPQFVGYSGNDYTEGGGLTPHDPSDVRGEEGPQESAQAGFGQG
ncbi:MAG: hypothetical protein ACMUHM_03075 [Thermoplasmatota archaeon]